MSSAAATPSAIVTPLLMGFLISSSHFISVGAEVPHGDPAPLLRLAHLAAVPRPHLELLLEGRLVALLPVLHLVSHVDETGERRDPERRAEREHPHGEQKASQPEQRVSQELRPRRRSFDPLAAVEVPLPDDGAVLPPDAEV